MERPWYRFYDEGVPRSMEYPEKTLPDLLRETAAKYPGKTATVFFGGQLAYGELKRQVDALAASLAGLGVKKGDRVAVMLPNCPQAIISAYAVFTLGAVTVMTNPLYVERELGINWGDAGVRTAIILDRLWPRVQKVRQQVDLKDVVVTGVQDYLPIPKNWFYPLKARLDKTWISIGREEGVLFFKELVARGGSPPRVDLSSSDLACLQYTGGTTGTPKGAMLTHRNLLCDAIQFIRYTFYRSREGEERFLAVVPFFHAYGMTAVMNTCVSKAWAMILVPRLDIEQLMGLIIKYRPTFFCGVPAMFAAINNYPKPVDITSIKACLCGAAPLPMEVMEAFERRTGGRIAEGYGLTEASMVTHINPIYGQRKPGSVGLPISDTDAKIVDVETGTREMPPGEVGELIIKGPQVMQGYWNRPEETAQTIRDGWLYTGDIGKMDEEGYFYILDRKKDIIIAGGYNIYPREVEEVLYEHPKIIEGAVIGVPDPYRGETVKAFVVFKPGEQATPEEIIAFCRERLAAFKIPRLIEFRESLPKTIVGKVLRKELREAEMKGGGGQEDKG
jgi:long-chain acyl-CoA synthetase